MISYLRALGSPFTFFHFGTLDSPLVLWHPILGPWSPPSRFSKLEPWILEIGVLDSETSCWVKLRFKICNIYISIILSVFFYPTASAVSMRPHTVSDSAASFTSLRQAPRCQWYSGVRLSGVWLRGVKNSNFRYEYFREIKAILEKKFYMSIRWSYTLCMLL